MIEHLTRRQLLRASGLALGALAVGRGAPAQTPKAGGTFVSARTTEATRGEPIAGHVDIASTARTATAISNASVKLEAGRAATAIRRRRCCTSLLFPNPLIKSSLDPNARFLDDSIVGDAIPTNLIRDGLHPFLDRLILLDYVIAFEFPLNFSFVLIEEVRQ